ncbi:MAG TPA: hypothetical protein PKH77_13480 [Anaerolineae bacterium]|nr:hypothetical protein [Anaerolineae bacterium]
MLIGIRTAKAMFRAAHRAAGKPTLFLIPPVETWTLPAGVTYDAYRDIFVTSGGAPQAVLWSDQVLKRIDYIPDRSITGLTFSLTGIVPEDTTPVSFLWSKETEAALRAAWGVSLGGDLYRVATIDLSPVGVSPAYLLNVSLRKGVLGA